MPLDFCLLAPDGSPADTIPVFLDQHQRLLQAATSFPQGFLLGCLGDYYADASLRAEEVGPFSSQLSALPPSFAGEPELVRLVESLMGLCRLAQQRSCGIKVSAD